jgi:hypothetical protein
MNRTACKNGRPKDITIIPPESMMKPSKQPPFPLKLYGIVTLLLI